MFIPTENSIAELEIKLRTFNGDLNAICNYYFDQGFLGCAIYSDSPNQVYDWNLHKSDQYIYILQGQLTIKSNDESVCLQAGDFFYLPALLLQKAIIGELGAKYVMASLDGDFSSTKGEMTV